jgi:hypothetical protein
MKLMLAIRISLRWLPRPIYLLQPSIGNASVEAATLTFEP